MFYRSGIWCVYKSLIYSCVVVFQISPSIQCFSHRDHRNLNQSVQVCKSHDQSIQLCKYVKHILYFCACARHYICMHVFCIWRALGPCGALSPLCLWLCVCLPACCVAKWKKASALPQITTLFLNNGLKNCLARVWRCETTTEPSHLHVRALPLYGAEELTLGRGKNISILV